jgi:hypothetical protein
MYQNLRLFKITTIKNARRRPENGNECSVDDDFINKRYKYCKKTTQAVFFHKQVQGVCQTEVIISST